MYRFEARSRRQFKWRTGLPRSGSMMVKPNAQELFSRLYLTSEVSEIHSCSRRYKLVPSWSILSFRRSFSGLPRSHSFLFFLARTKYFSPDVPVSIRTARDVRLHQFHTHYLISLPAPPGLQLVVDSFSPRYTMTKTYNPNPRGALRARSYQSL